MTVLETERLRLREWTRDDVGALAEIVGDPVTMRFWPAPLSYEAAQGWIERAIASYAANGFGRWALEERATGTLIGDCGIARNVVNGVEENDLGYIVHHPYWRRGYASEAALAVRDYGVQQLGLGRLVANMATEHHGSAAVARKLGMRLHTTFRNKRNRDLVTYLFVYEAPEQRGP